MGSFVDITGKRFGLLLVLRRDETKTRRVRWICKCDCGREISIVGENLKSGNTSTCGSAKHKMRPYIDLANLRFGRLLVVEVVGRRKPGRIYWLCICDCGKNTIAEGSILRYGKTKSCRCLKRENAGTQTIKHGGRKDKTGLYSKWKGIKARCLRPTCKEYKFYGARGIKICPEWEHDYAAFRVYILEVLGPRPSTKHSLDRIDNNGNYEPGNLRWATQKEQIQNSRHCLNAKTKIVIGKLRRDPNVARSLVIVEGI